MSQTDINILLRATDQATSVIDSVTSKLTGSMAQVEDANNIVKKSSDKVSASSKDVALAFNNIATGGFALYNSIDRVVESHVMLDRANLMVKRSTETVEAAQKAYNVALGKYEADSPEVKQAADKLAIAEDAHQVALERADLAQNNVNKSMAMAAMTVIPSIITMISSVSTITTTWSAATEAAGGALAFLAANPIVLVIAGIAALVAGLIWAYENCAPFRDAINAIGAVLSGAFRAALAAVQAALQWLWNNVFVPFGQFLSTVFQAYWTALSTIFNVVIVPALIAVQNAFSWLWHNVLDPLGKFLGGALLAAWNALANGISWAYNNVLKPVFDALSWVWNNVIKPIADVIGAIVGAVTGFLGGGGTPSNQNPNVGGHLQHGGIVMSPTLALIGEAGPEAVIPLNRPSIDQYMPVSKSGFGDIVIHGPIVNVEGSVDRATAEYAARLVQDRLRNVLVEASSSSATSTHKRIRMGT